MLRVFLCGNCERPLVTGRDRRCKLCNGKTEPGIFTNVFVASTKQTVRRYNDADPGLGDWYRGKRKELRAEFKRMSAATLEKEYEAIWEHNGEPDPRDDDDRSLRAEKLHDIKDAVAMRVSSVIDGTIDGVHRRLVYARYLMDTDEAARTPAFSHQELETLAKQFMIANGHPDARTTPPGPDGGIDVESKTAVAQVKHYKASIGRPDIQRLYGVARSKEKVAIFFAANGYTADAEAWARQYGVELHTFDHIAAEFHQKFIAAEIRLRRVRH